MYAHDPRRRECRRTRHSVRAVEQQLLRDKAKYAVNSSYDAEARSAGAPWGTGDALGLLASCAALEAR